MKKISRNDEQKEVKEMTKKNESTKKQGMTVPERLRYAGAGVDPWTPHELLRTTEAVCPLPSTR